MKVLSSGNDKNKKSKYIGNPFYRIMNDRYSNFIKLTPKKSKHGEAEKITIRL